MRTVQFRYGFHPEGMDPLSALRDPAHRSAPHGPAATLPARSLEATAPATKHQACPVVVPVSRRLPSPPVPARRPRLPGLHRYLFAAVVLFSGVAAAAVAGTGSEDASGEVARAAMVEVAPPTVIEPDALPAPELPDTLGESTAGAGERTERPRAAAADKPSVPSTPRPPTTSPPPDSPPVAPPVAPPDEPVAASPAPSVSLPPAVTWSVEPAETAAPQKPSIAIPAPQKSRPDVTVRPEQKPSLRVPPAARPRTPLLRPAKPSR